ncbi:hypothetical protein KBC89_03335 [Candidatus Woesebacteria bacterium]|nr:hypothetical protein [Candidatus Woesebacteria bacterium]
MENLAFVASVSLVVIAAVVVAVGIYLILLMAELRKVVHKLNFSLETTGSSIAQFIASLQHAGSYAMSFQAGVKTLESLAQWIRERTSKEEKTDKKK